MRVSNRFDGIWPRRYLKAPVSSCYVSVPRGGGDLPDKEDAHACVVLRAFHAEILVKSVELAVDNGISIEKVEEIHEPENGLET